MTPGEIIAVLTEAIEAGIIDACGLSDAGVPYYYGTFDCGDNEEPHDTAWSRSCDVSEFLESFGLRKTDTWSDNDSFGGNVIEDKQ